VGNHSDTATGTQAQARQKTRVLYDRLSRVYGIVATPFERRHKSAGLERLRVAPGERVLEIGFGTGDLIVSLARLVGETGRVSGIDLSDGMLSIAQRRVLRAGLSDRVRLEQGDAANLPFAADSFDAVFMSFTLELFGPTEVPAVLSECRRVLRAGGRICVVAMSRLGRQNLMTRLYRWANQRFPTMVDCRPILAGDAVTAAGFQIRESAVATLVGLPVEIVLALKV